MFKSNLVHSTSQGYKYLYSEQSCLHINSLQDPLHTALILMKPSKNGNRHLTSACHAHWIAAMDMDCQGLRPRAVLLGEWRLWEIRSREECLCHWGLTYVPPISFSPFPLFWAPWGKQLSSLHFPSLCACLVTGPQGQPFRNGCLQRRKLAEAFQSL